MTGETENQEIEANANAADAGAQTEADTDASGNGGAEQGGAEKPISTREALTAAMKDAKKNDDNQAATATPAKDAKNKAAAPGAAQAAAVDPNAAAAKPIEGPKSWPAHLRAEVAKLSPAAQKFVVEREESFARKVAEQDADRTFGKTMKEIAAPYEQIFRAEQTTPDKAVKALLNMAYVVRRGTPQQKVQLIMDTIRDFQIPMPQGFATQGPNGQQGGQLPPQVAQTIQALQGQVQMLNAKLNERETKEKQQSDATINRQIQDFASDPKHPHFEQVEAHMAALIQGGVAKDMEDAYNQAVYAHPELRQTLLAEQVAALNGQRKQDGQARVAAAKKAGSSVAGSPGRNAAAPAKKAMTTREAIVDAMQEVRGTS